MAEGRDLTIENHIQTHSTTFVCQIWYNYIVLGTTGVG